MTAPTHVGTRGRYVEGCRCEPCTRANNSYQRSRRSKRVNLPSEPLLSMYEGVPDEEVANRLGISRATLLRWKTRGISLTAGDRVAVRLGVHPLFIWGGDYWKATF